jgi:hypothetical protein
MHVAVANHQYKVIEALVTFGADINIVNKDGYNILDLLTAMKDDNYQLQVHKLLAGEKYPYYTEQKKVVEKAYHEALDYLEHSPARGKLPLRGFNKFKTQLITIESFQPKVSRLKVLDSKYI